MGEFLSREWDVARDLISKNRGHQRQRSLTPHPALVCRHLCEVYVPEEAFAPSLALRRRCVYMIFVRLKHLTASSANFVPGASAIPLRFSPTLDTTLRWISNDKHVNNNKTCSRSIRYSVVHLTHPQHYPSMDAPYRWANC